MARANLSVSDDLSTAFRNAQTAEIRLIRVLVNADEERIELNGDPVKASADAAADVHAYTAGLNE